MSENISDGFVVFCYEVCGNIFVVNVFSVIDLMSVFFDFIMFYRWYVKVDDM